MDEFEDLSGLPDGESQGEGTDSVPSTSLDELDDIQQDPRVRAMQAAINSANQRQLNDITRQLNELRMANQNKDETIEQLRVRETTIRQAVANLGDENAQATIDAMAELAELRSYRSTNERRQAEDAQRRQAEQANDQWRQIQEDDCRALGLDPNDSRFQKALDQSLAIGKDYPVKQAIIEMSKKAPAAPANSEENTRQRPDVGVPPPTGGTANRGSVQQQRLRSEYDAEMKKARGTIEKANIRRTFRQRGLEGL